MKGATDVFSYVWCVFCAFVGLLWLPCGAWWQPEEPMFCIFMSAVMFGCSLVATTWIGKAK